MKNAEVAVLVGVGPHSVALSGSNSENFRKNYLMLPAGGGESNQSEIFPVLSFVKKIWPQGTYLTRAKVNVILLELIQPGEKGSTQLKHPLALI